MKYSKLNLGKIEALVNKLGGEEGLKEFLSGKTEVVKKPVMFKKLPEIISISEKAELKIIKSDIKCPASDGKKLFSELDDSIKKTGYDGRGGDPEIKYWSDLNKISYSKKSAKLVTYEFSQNGIHDVSIDIMFHHLFSLVNGDLKKISLNADQVEHIVLNNQKFITEIGHNPSIFFIEADYFILPVSINPIPGGMGKRFETSIYSLGDMSSYRRVRFFVPQI